MRRPEGLCESPVVNEAANSIAPIGKDSLDPTIPQHDCVGFVSGDAQDHAAPTSPNRLAPRLLLNAARRVRLALRTTRLIVSREGQA